THGRRASRGAARRDARGHVRGRCLHPADARGSAYGVAGVACGAAGGPRRAGAAGVGRQGGHLLERAGHRGAGPGRGAARAAGVRLHRSSRRGTAGEAAGVADDYGNLAGGLLALHQATGEAVWLVRAGALLEVALAQFATGDGAFYDTPADGEQLVVRMRGASDNAEPCGTSALAEALGTYAALTGEHRDAADAAIGAGMAVARIDPRFAGWTLAAAEASLAGPLQVAVVGTDAVAEEMVQVVREATSPGLVLAAGPGDGTV